MFAGRESELEDAWELSAVVNNSEHAVVAAVHVKQVSSRRYLGRA